MARYGRSQTVNVQTSDNLFDPQSGTLAVTLQGVTGFATPASPSTGQANIELDRLAITAYGLNGLGELDVTLDGVTGTAQGSNTNVVIHPRPRAGGHGMHGAQRRHGIQILTVAASTATPPAQSTTTAESFILLQSGDPLLAESGDPLLLEENNG